MGPGDDVSRAAADLDEGVPCDGGAGMRPEVGRGTPGAGVASADVLQILHRHGYTVGIERRGWVECVVLRAGETWRGAGVDEPAALASALATMLPSGLARALFDRATREACAAVDLPPGTLDVHPSGAGEIAGRPPSPRTMGEGEFGRGKLGGEAAAPAPGQTISSATGEEASLRVATSDTETSAGTGPTDKALDAAGGAVDTTSAPARGDAAGPSEGHAAPATGADLEPGLTGVRSGRAGGADAEIESGSAGDRSGRDRGTSAEIKSGLTGARLCRAGATSAEIDRALAELDGVEAEIDGALDLALLAPRLLRCQISAWIARARYWQDRVPQRSVETKVARIAHRLDEFSKGYWPGNVPLLRLGTTPADACGLFPTEGRDWLDVAGDAERALLERAANEDEYGWCDAAALVPLHPAPAARLGDVEVEFDAIEATLRGVRRHADLLPQDKNQLDRDLPRLANQLRWLRGSIPDPARWGRAMGRLRRLAESGLDLPKRHALRVALDPATRPGRGGWAVKLRFNVAAHERARLLPALRAALPPDGAPSEAWVRWFEDAVEGVHVDELFGVVVQNRAARTALAGLGPEQFGKRNDRRRLAKIQKRLVDAAGNLAASDRGASIPANPKEVSGNSVTSAATEPSPVERARALIAGWPALVVSNRNDPTNQTALREKLGLDVDWLSIEGSGRIDDACARIRQGGYRIVLAATAFIGHSEEGRCRDACRAAEVPFVRAERCRPVGAAMHILQALGHAPPAPLLRHATAGG